MKIEELKSACDLLGLDYENFVEKPTEVEKGVEGVIDYKKLYEDQLLLNQTILGNIGEISKSVDSKIEVFGQNILEKIEKELKEVTKSYISIQEEVREMKETPMRKEKTVKTVNVIEKSVNENRGVKIFHLSNLGEKKQLKALLGNLALSELQKGVQNGIYEQAALQLDAGGLDLNIQKHLLDNNKIQVI